MASKEPKFLVTIKFANQKGDIRNRTILVSATDAEGAKKKAADIAALSYDWHRIGAVVPA